MKVSTAAAANADTTAADVLFKRFMNCNRGTANGDYKINDIHYIKYSVGSFMITVLPCLFGKRRGKLFVDFEYVSCAHGNDDIVRTGDFLYAGHDIVE